MVSKKTFEAVAAQFAKVHPIPVYQGVAVGETQWKIDVAAIADVFAAENPRFNRARFYRACGLEVR